MVVLVDARNVCYRVCWSYSAHHTSTGESTAIVHGFWMETFALHRKVPEAKIIFCWDGKAEQSWRKRLYPAYKGKRNVDPLQQEMTAQVNTAEEVIRPLLQQLGFWTPRIAGVEGDDLIGILAEALRHQEDEIRICSTDKDTYQLVKPNVFVWKNDTLLNARDVENLMGAPPEHVTEIRAMSGDASDNLKGLPGIGPKRALELWASGIRPMSPPPDGELAEHWPRLRLEFEMATIITTPDSPRWTLEQRAKLNELVKLLRASTIRRERNEEEIQDAWNRFLGRYELMELFSERHLLWDIP